MPARQKKMSFPSPSGGHRACPSAVLVLATPLSSRHRGVGSATAVLSGRGVCIAGATLILTNCERAVLDVVHNPQSRLVCLRLGSRHTGLSFAAIASVSS